MLLLGGIVKIARKSGSNSGIFYMLLTQENSRFQAALTTVCSWPEITFIFQQKRKTPSVLILTSLFKKQARDGQKEDSRSCYSLEHFFVVVVVR